MWKNIAVATSLALLATLAACGTPTQCKCGPGLLCEPETGACVAKNTQAQCAPTCGGTTPICDNATNPQAPRCVQCMTSGQCNGGTCNMTTHACVVSGTGGGNGDGGGPAGGGSGGGGAEDDGGLGGGDEDPGTGGGRGDGGTYVSTYDAGIWGGTGSCAPQDAGVVGGSCVPSCAEGFTCLGGMCVLNGGNGPVQVTLRWNTQEDLDLHLLEPSATTPGGWCEIYYGDPNSDPQSPSACGAKGWLDLDSEAACPSPSDFVDIENIIYSPGTAAPRGVYEVWVDHYMNCNASLAVVPFEIEARANGVTIGMCGAFLPSDPDWDNSNQTLGRKVLTFTVP